MANTTGYIVIFFFIGKRGRLTAGQAQPFKTREQAVRAYDRLRELHAGTVLLEQEADTEADIYGEPKLIAQHGQLPEGFVEQLAA